MVLSNWVCTLVRLAISAEQLTLIRRPLGVCRSAWQATAKSRCDFVFSREAVNSFLRERSFSLVVAVVVEVEVVSSVSIRSFPEVKRGGDSRGLCGRSGSVEKRMSSIVVGLFRGPSAMESKRVSLGVLVFSVTPWGPALVVSQGW